MELPNFTPRITRPYADLSAAILDIKVSSFRTIVCQHEADGEINNTHIHALLYNCSIKEEAFKRQINKHFIDPLKGNKDWSWVSKLPSTERNEFWIDAEPLCAKEKEIVTYVTYMLKGDKNNLVYKNNVPDTFIDKCVSNWNDKTKIEKITMIVKEKKVPYQQDVMAGAAAEWLNYCKSLPESQSPDMTKLKEIICVEMRRVSKGINVYLIRDIAMAILFDNLDYRQMVLDKIKL